MKQLSGQFMKTESIEASFETKIVNVHSAAIHIENKAKLVQRKVWFELVYKAFPNFKNQNIFSIYIKDLKEAIGWEHSKNDEMLKELLHGLTSCAIQWNIFGKDKTETWTSNALLAGCEIEKDSGICHYAFSPFLQKKLCNPEMYVKIDLIVSHMFQSKYSLAIYCLALDYLNFKLNYGEKNFTIDELRRYMALGENEYKLVGDFNRRIIKPAEKEINEVSDLSINITPIMDGKKITGFKFSFSIKDERIHIYNSKRQIESKEYGLIGDNSQQITKNNPIQINNVILKKFFADHNISIMTDTVQEKLREISQSLGMDRLEQYLLFLKDYAEQEQHKGKVKKFAGFFIGLIKDDAQVDNYIFYLEQKKLNAEEKRLRIESLIESKLKIKHEGFLSEDFKIYVSGNIDQLENKFVEIMRTTVEADSMVNNLIARNNNGIIDKSLITSSKNTTRMMVFNHIGNYKSEFGYSSISFEEWKSKTLNEEYLNNLKKEIETEVN